MTEHTERGDGDALEQDPLEASRREAGAEGRTIEDQGEEGRIERDPRDPPDELRDES